MRTPLARRARSIAIAVVLSGTVALALTSCAGSTSDGAAVTSPAAQEAKGAPAPSAARQVAGAAAPSKPAELVDLGQQLIQTGSIGLRSRHVGLVVAKVEQIATESHGTVTAEDTQTDRRGTVVSSQIVLGVPAAVFGSAITDLSRLGTLVDVHRSSRDVTTAIADVSSRVTSAKLAIGQLRRLMARATKLGQVIELEDQLATREADLESLQAQQRALDGQVALATITVSVNAVPVAPAKRPAHEAGFIAGIQQGAHAFVALAVGVGHVLGITLPIGGLFITLVVACLLVIRRVLRLGRRAPPAAE